MWGLCGIRGFKARELGRYGCRVGVSGGVGLLC